MSGKDKFTRHGEAWTEDTFLTALRSRDDRELAVRLFHLNQAIPGSWRWFGTWPGGAVFFHPGGVAHAPLRVLTRDGVLFGQGTWNVYGDVRYDDGFREMSDFLGQDHRSTPKRFPLADVDLDELWAMTLRCAAAVNSGTPVVALPASPNPSLAQQGSAGAAGSTRTWIFQANPDRYDIRAVLENREPIAEWSISQHVDDLQIGDRAVLWIGGRRDPGVYAVGTVTGQPFAAVIDDPRWRRAEDQTAPMLRCPIRFDTFLMEAPVLRADLKADPRFAGSRIITQPFAGNPFLVTETEWEAIADRLTPTHSAPARSAANVWLEVQHRAREWMDAGTPVYTLKRNVRNIITNVTDSKIERQSDEPRGAGDAPVTRRKIEELWEALLAEGHTRNIPNPLYLAHALLQRAIPGVGYVEDPRLSLVLTDPDEANRLFDPAAEEVPGLVTAAGLGTGRGRGGGGEGPIHAALKEKVKTDPVAAVGERLTYITEDLTDRLGDEIAFITGDRADLLMKDEQGNYVVIEVEPAIGPTDHIGFHQAAKYWVLVAVAKGIDLDRVRRMVVATEIDRGLAEHYQRRYAIESVEVGLP